MTLVNKFAELTDQKGMTLAETGLLSHYIPKGSAKYESLKKNPPATWEDDYFAGPEFEEARLAEDRLFELYLGKVVPPEEVAKCPRCGGSNILLTKVQTQRADEGGRARGKCGDCGNNFMAN